MSQQTSASREEVWSGPHCIPSAPFTWGCCWPTDPTSLGKKGMKPHPKLIHTFGFPLNGTMVPITRSVGRRGEPGGVWCCTDILTIPWAVFGGCRERTDVRSRGNDSLYPMRGQELNLTLPSPSCCQCLCLSFPHTGLFAPGFCLWMPPALGFCPVMQSPRQAVPHQGTYPWGFWGCSHQL